jgi:hypothetical protein
MEKQENKKSKVCLWAGIVWAVNIKLFLIISNFAEVSQIYNYSQNFLEFYKNSFSYFYDFIFTIPTTTLLLSIIFAILLFYFWLIYFKVYFYKLPNIKNTLSFKDAGVWGILGTVFTFLGFGCVACGQTLLYSILFLFASSGSLLTHYIGEFSILVGIFFLTFGIYKNLQILKNKNICKF